MVLCEKHFDSLSALLKYCNSLFLLRGTKKCNFDYIYFAVISPKQEVKRKERT